MKFALALALMTVIAAPPAQAQEIPQWILRAGVHPVQPEPHKNEQLQMGDGAAITFAATYMLGRHWGIEALAALPIEHEITLQGSGTVASVRQVPPTLSVQYYFLDPNGRIRGYVGAGINSTTFFDESTRGALHGSELELADSWGPALQAGLDFEIGRRWFVSLDARWFDIDTTAHLNGSHAGTLELDPYAVGMTIGRWLP